MLACADYAVPPREMPRPPPSEDGLGCALQLAVPSVTMLPVAQSVRAGSSSGRRAYS
jgi:hypothetical protein